MFTTDPRTSTPTGPTSPILRNRASCDRDVMVWMAMEGMGARGTRARVATTSINLREGRATTKPRRKNLLSKLLSTSRISRSSRALRRKRLVTANLSSLTAKTKLLTSSATPRWMGPSRTRSLLSLRPATSRWNVTRRLKISTTRPSTLKARMHQTRHQTTLRHRSRRPKARTSLPPRRRPRRHLRQSQPMEKLKLQLQRLLLLLLLSPRSSLMRRWRTEIAQLPRLRPKGFVGLAQLSCLTG
mmetsp:Transcript_34262/g.77158  ORF Transcript_34262/g.77158 Transcript_34262/m.77158 type:complete len:243 (-) Transcript_34262:464-1192(-)